MPTRVRSFSKINLGLAVGPPRADNFHGLATMYQTLALHDFVTVTARASVVTSIHLQANHPGVPCTAKGNAERNTAWKMVAGALARMGVTAEVNLEIEKRLPVQGGMGAGSANAAAALLGLERELGRALPKAERLLLAAEVGSDVPLFLLGGTVLGLGRGEEVYPLPDLPTMPCVIAVPGMGVSTALAFRDLDRRQSVSGRKGVLTFQQPADKLKQLSRILAAVWTTDGAESGPSGITRATADASESKQAGQAQRGDLAENPLLALVRTGIENDFEEVVFSQHPSLRSTKRDLLGPSGNSGGSALNETYSESALYAGLSGSGSALFGLYGSQAAAIAAQYRVQASGTRAILTETLSRAGYWDTMFAE
jgi:4-diphosphocytidyl-2-C-methyl-D-erythritol kinase